jgi:hypothetical protein
MDDEQQAAIHEAMEAALDELAAHLGGTSDMGGPVENTTQIKGHSELGILLTDVEDRVLGRVWVAFGGALQTVGEEMLDGGSIEIQAEVCSEVVEPPVALETWVIDHL